MGNPQCWQHGGRRPNRETGRPGSALVPGCDRKRSCVGRARLRARDHPPRGPIRSTSRWERKESHATRRPVSPHSSITKWPPKKREQPVVARGHQGTPLPRRRPCITGLYRSTCRQRTALPAGARRALRSAAVSGAQFVRGSIVDDRPKIRYSPRHDLHRHSRYRAFAPGAPGARFQRRASVQPCVRFCFALGAA